MSGTTLPAEMNADDVIVLTIHHLQDATELGRVVDGVRHWVECPGFPCINGCADRKRLLAQCYAMLNLKAPGEFRLVDEDETA